MSTMNQTFSDFPIGRKIFLIPVLTVFCFIFVGWLFQQSYKNTLLSLTRADEAQDIFTVLRDTNIDLSQSKSDLLQAISWKMGYVENTKVIEKITSSLELADKVGASLKKHSGDLERIGLKKSDLDTALADREAYKGSLKGTADIVPVDPDTAIITLNDTLEKFNTLHQDISKIVARAGQVRDDTVSNLKKTLSANMYNFLGSIAISAVILLGLGAIIGRAISSPIQLLTDVVTTIAGGDLAVKIPSVARRDEVGNIAKAVEVFKEGLLKNKTLQEGQKSKQEAETRRAEALSSIVRKFEAKITDVVNLFKRSSVEMQNAAESLGMSVETSEKVTTNVSAASTQAMSNVQTVATAVQEMASSIREISNQISKTQTIVSTTVELTRHADAETQSLSQSAEKIGEIIGLIQDIAEQTNLLALNATIEAARAGDAGKGFAVVASEVKELASQTAKATEQISRNISSVQDISKSVTQAIENIRRSIDEVSTYSSSVAASVEEQSNVTDEISKNMKSAADSVEEISQNMMQVVTAVDDVKLIADKVRGTSDDLSKQIGGLNESVTTFCSGINSI
jgi:methyl-accepting chemotaxis protein